MSENTPATVTEGSLPDHLSRITDAASALTDDLLKWGWGSDQMRHSAKKLLHAQASITQLLPLIALGGDDDE